MELVKKLSAKSVVGNPMSVIRAAMKDAHDRAPQEGDSAPLYRVYGVARGVKNGQSNFGEWTAFKGEFAAVSLETGEQFRSGELFLPEVAEALLIGPVKDGDGSGVQFAFEIGARAVKDRADDKNLKYEYTVRSLVELSKEDPLAQMASTLPALPAPRKAAPQQQALATSDPEGDQQNRADAAAEVEHAPAAKKAAKK
jgi:hypothetical protein